MAMRTGKGNVTEEARDKSGNKEGKFPIFDHKSAMSAIKLRHNGKGVTAESVLSRAARWATSHNDKAVLNAVAAARQADKKRK
jgi:hypothetical protein